MQRNRMSPRVGAVAGWELRQAVAIIGMIATGVVSALTLPLWMAALCMLLALGAMRVVTRPEPALEPVVVRRDERR